MLYCLDLMVLVALVVTEVLQAITQVKAPLMDILLHKVKVSQEVAL